MNDFTEVISKAENDYFFNFRKVSTPSGSKYFVWTMDKHDSVSFEIEVRVEMQLLEPVPDWIKELELELFAIIRKIHLF